VGRGKRDGRMPSASYSDQLEPTRRNKGQGCSPTLTRSTIGAAADQSLAPCQVLIPVTQEPQASSLAQLRSASYSSPLMAPSAAETTAPSFWRITTAVAQHVTASVTRIRVLPPVGRRRSVANPRLLRHAARHCVSDGASSARRRSLSTGMNLMRLTACRARAITALHSQSFDTA
jgi:hypothetical protein